MMRQKMMQKKINLIRTFNLRTAFYFLALLFPLLLVSGARAQFVQDTFGASGGSGNAAGTDLSAHTGEIGATWTKITGQSTNYGGSLVLTPTHTVRAGANAEIVYTPSGTPASANYTVTAVWSCVTVLTAGQVGVEVRRQAGADTAYISRYNTNFSVWELYKDVAGSYTRMDSNANGSYPMTAGHTYTQKVTASGTSITTTVSDNGAAAQTVSTITDNAITGAGSPSLRFEAVTQSDTTGLQCVSYTAANPPAANVRPVTEIAYCSPDNTYSDGSGTIQANNVKTGATFITWNTPGSYLKTTFGGTSCVLNLNLSALTGASTPAGYYPVLRWSIDNGPNSTPYLLTSSDTALSVASGLASGSHTLFLQFVGFGGGTSTTPDRYNTPVAAVTITGITLDASTSLSSIAASSRVVLTTADSLGEGVRVNGASGLYTDQDAFGAIGWQLAQALSAEWSSRSIGGGGWTVAGSGNTPPYFTPGNDTNSWWNKYSAGRPLLVGGLLPVQPYLWFNFYGTNDGLQSATDSAVSSSVSGWLPNARTAAPNAYIVIGIPPGGYKRSALLSGFTTYQGTVTSKALSDGATIYAGANDAKTFMIDEGTAFQVGLNQLNTPSLQSGDGLHPLRTTDTIYAARVAAHFQQAIAPASATAKRRLQ